MLQFKVTLIVILLSILVYNWCEVRVKMWFLNLGKPDSIPPLNEQMAIELGANLLGETIVFVSAAGVILLEYSRQVRKEEAKETARREEILDMQRQLQDLSFRAETHDAQIREVLHGIAELHSKTIRIPWKGSGKPNENKEPPKNEVSNSIQKKGENLPVTDKEVSSSVSHLNMTSKNEKRPEKLNQANEEEKKR